MPYPDNTHRIRWVSTLCLCLIPILFLSLIAGAAPSSTHETSNSQDRLRWFDQHMAMKDASIFNNIPWRYIGPDIISGRCTDIAVPGRLETHYICRCGYRRCLGNP